MPAPCGRGSFRAVSLPELMPPTVAALVPLVVAYLVGALPFGYLVGRLRGVNLFAVGSGNIGATNAGRVLGARYGALVFLLDFLKGAVPVAAAVPLANAFGSPDVVRVGAAALAFLGHLFPVYLGFRGGKGVATGAGTVFVLVPLAALLAITVWGAVLFASRLVSLASLAAAVALVVVHLLATRAPFAETALPVTLYLLAGAAMVFVKHRANVKRLLTGSENVIGEFSMRQPVLRSLHVLSLGLWFGGAAFFNFGAATAIFASFTEVVNAGPSDRTAHEIIFTPSGDAAKDAERKKALASALAGSAVGPVFPRYFAMQAVCGVVALLAALAWWKRGGVHKWRVLVIAFALLTVAVGWPISDEVSRLRLARFDPDAGAASAAKAAFATWHLVSLALSFVTVCAAGVALALAGSLPKPEAI